MGRGTRVAIAVIYDAMWVWWTQAAGAEAPASSGTLGRTVHECDRTVCPGDAESIRRGSRLAWTVRPYNALLWNAHGPLIRNRTPSSAELRTSNAGLLDTLKLVW